MMKTCALALLALGGVDAFRPLASPRMGRTQVRGIRPGAAPLLVGPRHSVPRAESARRRGAAFGAFVARAHRVCNCNRRRARRSAKPWLTPTPSARHHRERSRWRWRSAPTSAISRSSHTSTTARSAHTPAPIPNLTPSLSTSPHAFPPHHAPPRHAPPSHPPPLPAAHRRPPPRHPPRPFRPRRPWSTQCFKTATSTARTRRSRSA